MLKQTGSRSRMNTDFRYFLVTLGEGKVATARIPLVNYNEWRKTYTAGQLKEITWQQYEHYQLATDPNKTIPIAPNNSSN